jgi:hypothetical protein
MKQARRIAAVAAVIIAGLAASARAQTNVVYVTNAYDLKAQQVAAGAVDATTRYTVFSGEAKAVNNKVAADIKPFVFTVFYAADDSGVVTVTGGNFLFQTTTRDRLPLFVGGDILPGDVIALRSNGWIAAGETLTLPMVGSDGTGITGTITATIDKSNPPRAFGSVSLTYPVVQ